MMLVFNVLLHLLSGVQKVLAYRASRLERKFARLAREVYDLCRDPLFKEGNTNRLAPLQAAKRQYLLGALVQKKDRLEALHDRWALRAEKVQRAAMRLSCWQGRR